MRKRYFVVTVILVSYLLSACSKVNEPLKKEEPVVTPTPLPSTPVVPPTSVKLAVADSVLVLQELYSGAKEAKRLAQNFPASDFSTTGFYLSPGATAEIEVNFIKGSHRPVLLVGTYSRYKDKWNPTSYTLNSGINKITDATGGIMYIRLFNDNPDTEVKIKFLSGFKPIPYFKKGITTQTQWQTTLEKITDVPDVQLVSDRTIITNSYINALKSKNENMQSLLNIADRVINIEDSISGLFGSDPLDQPNQHKYLLTESDHPDYYMAATYYRTWYRGADAVSAILSSNNFTWGPWHELGHMHQQAAWTWSELTEVTVNVYSLAVQKALGITSRLKQENKWADAFNYLNQSEANKNFNASSVSVWVRLCMFQQLKLAFGDEFYHKLHRTARRETNTPSTTDTKMKWFMVQSCKTSGKNLSGFFKKWGMNLSTQALTDAVHTEIASLNLPQPDTDISLLQD